MNYNTAIIGNISHDINIDHKGEVEDIIGGAVLHSVASAVALGHNILSVTKLKEKDKKYLNNFLLPKENVHSIFSDHTYSIENKYFTADKEKRTCICKEKGDEILLSDIPKKNVQIYHLAGLMKGDFSDELIIELSNRGKVAVDMQGFLRCTDQIGNSNPGKVWFEDYKNKEKIFPYISFLKVDTAEAEILTKLTDRHDMAKKLFDYGAKELMITNSKEVMIYNGKEFNIVPIRARSLVGRTGRGDTCFSAYINERVKNDIKKSLLTATALVSHKMEKTGIYKGNRGDVENYIHEFYKDYV